VWLQAEEKTAALGAHGPDPALAGDGGGGGRAAAVGGEGTAATPVSLPVEAAANSAATMRMMRRWMVWVMHSAMSATNSSVARAKPSGKRWHPTVGHRCTALHTTNGTKKWSFATDPNPIPPSSPYHDSGIYACPILSADGTMLFIGSANNNTYALNISDGTKIWSYATGGGL
jgi:outer membrane protein assembly factor BamB